MDNFFDVFRRWNDFQGRSSRHSYWTFFLANLLLGIVLMAVDIFVFGNNLIDDEPFFTVSTLYSLLVLVPFLALSVRRFHDMHKSGWWCVLLFVPLVGFITTLYLIFVEGDNGSNDYGVEPDN